MKDILIKTFVLFIFLFLFSGCIADLGLLEEMDIAEGSAAVDEIIEQDINTNISELSQMGITEEDLSIFKENIPKIESGNLLDINEVAFNSELDKIELRYSGKNDPELYLRGADEPFARVLPSEEKIKLFNGKIISFDENLFSVNQQDVGLRKTTSFSSGNLVTTLSEGDLVIELNEKNDWYRVRVIKNKQVQEGFVLMSSLTPLIIAKSKKKNNRKINKHNFCDKYLNLNVFKNLQNQNSVVIVAIRNGRKINKYLNQYFIHNGVNIQADLFKKEFFNSIIYDRIKEGDVKALELLGINTLKGYLILGQLNLKNFRNSKLNVVRGNLSLNLLSMNSEKVNKKFITTRGSGFTRKSALKQLYKRLENNTLNSTIIREIEYH